MSKELHYFRPLPDDFEKFSKKVMPVPRGEPVSRKAARTDITYFAVNQLGLTPYYWQHQFWKDIVLGKNVMVCSARQVGKAQPIDAEIQTPNGPIKMGDVRVGQKIFAGDGSITEVTGVFPQGMRPTYKITFTDGGSTECDEEHLWKYKSSGKGRHWRVNSLKELLKRKGGVNPTSDQAFRIPLCKPVDYCEKELGVFTPYAMGAFLGDGSFRECIRFSTVDEEILNRLKGELPSFLKWDFDNRCSYRISDPTKFGNILIDEVKRLGLWNKKSEDKFIPKDFLYSDYVSRLDLLRGLMDTDGSIYGNMVMEFTTNSKQLSLDFKTLVLSLGGKCLVKEKVFKGKIYYRCYPKLWDLNPFYLKRKADKYHNIKYEPCRIVESIEFIGEKECQCIQVAHEDHTYLTNDFIVTHNTAALSIFALWACTYNTMPLVTTKRTRIVIVSKSIDQSKKVISDVREWIRIGDDRVRELTKGKVENFFSAQIGGDKHSANTKGIITFNNGCEIISLPPTDSARGYTGSILLLDEAAFFPEEEIFNQTLRPIVSQTGNRIIMTSTPNGQQGFFYKYFDPDNSQDVHEFSRMWIPYTSLYLDDPSIVLARDDMRKIQYAMGNNSEFDQEHMASFNASTESFFISDDIDVAAKSELFCVDKYTGLCDIGVDFGAGKYSRTVVTITALITEGGKSKIRILSQIEYHPDNDASLVDDVVELSKKFNIQRIILEDCPAAATHVQGFVKSGLNYVLFNPSGEKVKKYYLLRSWFRQKRVEFPNELKELIKQAKGLLKEETPTRTKIHHGAGLRDDNIDSFMLSTYYFTEDKSTFRVWDWDDF